MEDRWSLFVPGRLAVLPELPVGYDLISSHHQTCEKPSSTLSAANALQTDPSSPRLEQALVEAAMTRPICPKQADS